MQIIFQKAVVEDEVGRRLGAAQRAVSVKAKGDNSVVVRRPNSLTRNQSGTVGKPGAGGSRASTGAGGKGGGGKIEGLDMSTGAGVQMGASALTRTAGGKFAKYEGVQTTDERVAGLSKGDADAARSLGMGGAIDKATQERLAALGLLTYNAKGQIMITGEARNAMIAGRETAAQQAEKYKKGEQAKAKAESEAAGKAKEAEREKKAEEKAAKRKIEVDKLKAEAKVENEKAKVAAKVEKDAAVAKAAANKEQEKIKLIQDAEEAQKKQQIAQRKTLDETAVSAGMDKSSVDGLMNFVKGDDLEYGSPIASKLLSLGLISQVPGTRQYVIGQLASSFLNTAMSGNKRGAKDMLLQYQAQQRAQAATTAAQEDYVKAQAAQAAAGGGAGGVRTIMPGGSAKPLPFSPILNKTKELGVDSARPAWVVFEKFGGANGVMALAQKAINIVFGKS